MDCYCSDCSDREAYRPGASQINFTDAERSYYVNRYSVILELEWDEDRGQWFREETSEFIPEALIQLECKPQPEPAHGDLFWFCLFDAVYCGAYDSRAACEKAAWDGGVIEELAVAEERRR